VLVPPDDPDALAKAIRSLLEQPETRRALGARARARIDAAYAWPRVAEHTVAQYRTILAEREERGRSSRLQEVGADRGNDSTS
jgi:glycosyltransferase involved in cell wall biosynthesis